MPISFPLSPTQGQTHQTGGKTWTWTGTTWNLLATANLVSAGSIVPSQNSSFDLGTSSLRWRDLYLSGNSLIIGGATISATDSNLVLPQGTTIVGTGLLGATVQLVLLVQLVRQARLADLIVLKH